MEVRALRAAAQGHGELELETPPGFLSPRSQPQRGDSCLDLLYVIAPDKKKQVIPKKELHRSLQVQPSRNWAVRGSCSMSCRIGFGLLASGAVIRTPCELCFCSDS